MVVKILYLYRKESMKVANGLKLKLPKSHPIVLTPVQLMLLAELNMQDLKSVLVHNLLEKIMVERMRSFPQQKFSNLASHFCNNGRHCHKAFTIKCIIIKTFLYTW